MGNSFPETVVRELTAEISGDLLDLNITAAPGPDGLAHAVIVLARPSDGHAFALLIERAGYCSKLLERLERRGLDLIDQAIAWKHGAIFLAIGKMKGSSNA